MGASEAGKGLIRLQAGDEVVRRAGDHGEAAGVDGVLVPVLEHAMGVLELVLDPNQRLHCRQGVSEICAKPIITIQETDRAETDGHRRRECSRFN